jgi:hypothetical protein
MDGLEQAYRGNRRCLEPRRRPPDPSFHLLTSVGRLTGTPRGILIVLPQGDCFFFLCFHLSFPSLFSLFLSASVSLDAGHERLRSPSDSKASSSLFEVIIDPLHRGQRHDGQARAAAAKGRGRH